MLARLGSKRLPRKNLLPICGKPMFEWNLEKALGLFGDVYVSSDSEEILARAQELGARPIARPPELAADSVPDMPVFIHALPLMGYPDVVFYIQANSPTLDIQTIKKALRIMNDESIRELTTVDANMHVHGSVWALRRERIENYGDPYVYKAEVFLRDDAIDIHTREDFDRAEAILRAQQRI